MRGSLLIAALMLAGCEKPTDPVKLCNYWPGQYRYVGSLTLIVDEHGREYATTVNHRALTPTGVNYGPRQCSTVTRAEWKAEQARREAANAR